MKVKIYFQNEFPFFLDFDILIVYNLTVKTVGNTERGDFRPGIGLKAKFSLWMILFIIAVMAVTYLYYSYQVGHRLTREIKKRGETVARNVAANSRDPLGNENDLQLASFVHNAMKDNEGVVYCFIMGKNDKIWASTYKEQLNKVYVVPEGLERLEGKVMLVQATKSLESIEVYDIAVPVRIKDTVIGEVHIGISRDVIKESIKATSKGMIIVTVATIFFGVIGILVLISYIIGSLGVITQDIVAIGNGDLDRAILVKRRDEIGRIAQSVKEMAHKLRNAREELVEKERMKKEMQIAKEIQHTLLPQRIPTVPGYQIESYYESAVEVGGDYYDYINVDKNHFGVVVADVSGKGVAGSIIMTMVRSMLRMDILQNLSPHNLLSTTNFLLKNDIPEGMFITLFYVLVDIDTGEISYSCAGHNPAFLYDNLRNSIVTLKPKGPPFGIPLYDGKEFSKRLKEEKRILRSGDTLILYTDGITEALNERTEQFGEERLKRVLLENSKRNVTEIKETLLSSVRKFTGNASQSDDITFVLVKKL